MLLLCSGCMDIVELREQTFIVGLGIDQAEDNLIEVSLTEINLQNDGKEQASSDNPGKSRPYHVRTAKAKTISECFRILRTEHFKQMTLSKVSFIVFGEALAKKGLDPFKDFVMRSNEIDLSVQMFVTEKRVKELFEADNGVLLEFTTRGFQYLPTYIPSYLWKMLSQASSPLEATYLNRVRIDKGRINFVGEAFMLMNQIKVILNFKESRGVNILLDNKWKDIVLFIDDEETTSIQVKKVSRKERYTPSQVSMTYKVSGTILESHIQHPIQNVNQLEKSGALHIEKKMTDLMKKATKEGVDLLGIGETFRQRGWDTSDWQNQIQHLPIDVHVELNIVDGGAMID